MHVQCIFERVFEHSYITFLKYPLLRQTQYSDLMSAITGLRNHKYIRKEDVTNAGTKGTRKHEHNTRP